MNRHYKTGERGLIKWIIIIVIALVLASYFFDFSVQDVIEDEQTQSNFGYIEENFTYLYDIYLRDIVDYLWNDIFIELIWNNFVGNLESIQNGELTVFEQMGRQQGEFLNGASQ